MLGFWPIPTRQQTGVNGDWREVAWGGGEAETIH